MNARDISLLDIFVEWPENVGLDEFEPHAHLSLQMEESGYLIEVD